MADRRIRLKSASRRTFSLAALASLTGLAVRPGWAQSGWPARPIKVIVPFSPGGTQDITARLLSDPLSKRLGVPVIVDNRPGGQSMIGIDMVAKSAPDGYTIGTSSAQGHAQLPALMPDRIPFNPLKDFTPLSLLVTQAAILMVHPSVPAKTVPEFLSWAKAGPPKVYGSTSIGSFGHITVEIIAHQSGAKLEHIPYKTRATLVTEFIGGQIPIMVDPLPSALPLVKDGRARAIAIAASKRSGLVPDLPTLYESGFKDLTFDSWLAFYGPAGIPAPVVSRLNTAMVDSLHDEPVRKKMMELGFDVVGSSPAELFQTMKTDLDRYAAIAKRLNIKVD